MSSIESSNRQEIQVGNSDDNGTSTIDISQLPVHQLNAIKQQMEQVEYSLGVFYASCLFVNVLFRVGS